MAKNDKKPAPLAEEKEQEKVITDDYKGEEPEVVSVPKDVFEKLLKDVENMKKGQTEEGLEPVDVGKRIVKVRMINEKAVLKVGSVFTERDKFGEKIEFINVELADGGKPLKVRYEDFVTADQVEAVILDWNKKEIRDHYRNSFTAKTEVTDYKTVATGKKVPVMVISTNDTFKVELPDGNVVELKQDAVN